MPDLQEPDWLLQVENILETLNEGVVIADDALRVVFANETLLRLTGNERGELLGRTPEGLFPAEDVPYLMQQYAIAQHNRHHRHEYNLPRKNGERASAGGLQRADNSRVRSRQDFPPYAPPCARLRRPANSSDPWE